jgi:Outer membrane protein/protective antigen OMA87
MLLAASPGSAPDATPLRIGAIRIQPLDVYSSEEASHGKFYRLADRLHAETRGSVIEQFLLFHTGDVYRPEVLAETERNLRALHFLKSASVMASTPHDGVVDVTVTTQDSWSIAPETQAGSSGGKSTFGATLSDNNVLGTGKNVEVAWSRGVDRTRMSVLYNDPSFFAPYWQARFGYAVNSDGYDHRFSVVRPFYSFSTPWSAELSFTGYRQNDRLYAGGLVEDRFRQTHRQIVASLGTALTASDLQATRLIGGIRFQDDAFGPLTAPARQVTESLGRSFPATREFRSLFVRYESCQNDYLTWNYVNKDVRYEDFNLGRQSSVEAALSTPLLGADATIPEVRLRASNGLRWSEQSFIVPSISLSSRYDRGLANTLSVASVQFVHRSDSERPRVLVGRAIVSSGWRLDPEQQLFADGLTGLRGYRAHSFEGDRSIVLNLEQRIYLGKEILQLASPGLVAFVDAGNATNGGLASLLRLKTDVGVGIRIGLPRTPKNLLRLDLSYALNPDPLGRSGWMVSFSSGQAF